MKTTILLKKEIKMITTRNNHAFKGHKTLLGSKYVTYGEVELPTRYELFAQSKNGFDWGSNSPSSKQLAFSILYQISDEEFANKNASKFSNDIIQNLNSRDWVLNTSDVINWINKNTEFIQPQKDEIPVNVIINSTKKTKRAKTNVVKDVCKQLEITQKNLAEILEVPEGTVSSWAVKNEIPRLGKKAIEFYILNRKNQDIVDSYKNFVTLLNVS